MGDLITYVPEEYYTLKMLKGSLRMLKDRQERFGAVYKNAAIQEERQYKRALEDYRAGKPIVFH